MHAIFHCGKKGVGWKNSCLLWEARCFFHGKQRLGGQKLNRVLGMASGTFQVLLLCPLLPARHQQ